MDDTKIQKFILDSRAQGIPDDQILAFVKSKQAQVQPTVGQTIKTDLQERGQNISDINTMRSQGQSVAQETLNTVAPKLGEKISPLLSKLQKVRQTLGMNQGVYDIATTGQLAGGVNDVIGGVLSPVIKTVGSVVPEGVKNFVGDKVKQLVQTELGQLGINTIEDYNVWAEKNPLSAKNLEGAVNIASLFPTGKAAEVGVDVIESGLKATKQLAGDITTKGGEALGTITKPITESVSNTFNPEQIMQRVARIPKGEQAKFQKMTGESVGEYLTSRNIFGNEEEILSKLYSKFDESKKVADDALAKLDGKFKPKEINNALSELVKKEARVSVPGAISKDAKRVTQLLGKYKTDGLTMSEINEVKRLYERNIKVDYLKSAAMNPEKVTLATNIDSAIRNWQMKQAVKMGLQNLSAINKEIQAAKSLLDSFGKEVMGSAGNNALGLTDAVLLSGGDPASIGMLVTKKVLSSKGVQSKIADLLSKGGAKKLPVKAQFGKVKPDLTDFLTK